MCKNKGKLISILGTNDYIKCNYDEFKNCEYIQEALARKHGNNLTNIIIFATDEARDINYYENEYRYGSRKGENKKGLKKRLEEIRDNYDFDFKLKLKIIPEVNSEKDLWEIFNIIISELDKEDEIYFDVTHGYRYYSLLIMNILNYAKLIKDINVKKVEYGLFEKLGPASKVQKMKLENRNAKILDLTTFDYLNDWISGIDSFISTGEANKIVELSGKPIGKGIANSIKQSEDEKEFFELLSKLGKSLKYFNNEIKTARGNRINDTLLNIINNLNKLKTFDLEKNSNISPFINLINKIDDKFKIFDGNDQTGIKNYFILLKWCKKHGLVHQGLVIVRENFISLIAQKMDMPYLPEHNRDNEYNLREIREEINTVINSKILPEFDIDKRNIDKDKYNQINSIIEGLDDVEELLSLIKKFKQKRNDVSHLGLSDSSSETSQSIIDFFDIETDNLIRLLKRNNYYLQ